MKIFEFFIKFSAQNFIIRLNYSTKAPTSETSFSVLTSLFWSKSAETKLIKFVVLLFVCCSSSTLVNKLGMILRRGRRFFVICDFCDLWFHWGFHQRNIISHHDGSCRYLYRRHQINQIGDTWFTNYQVMEIQCIISLIIDFFDLVVNFFWQFVILLFCISCYLVLVLNPISYGF